VPEKLRSSITFWHTEWLLSGFGAPSISCYAWSAALFVFFLILARVGGRRTWKHVRLIRTTSEVFPVCALVRAAPNVGFANYWDQNWGTYPFFPTKLVNCWIQQSTLWGTCNPPTSRSGPQRKPSQSWLRGKSCELPWIVRCKKPSLPCRGHMTWAGRCVRTNPGCYTALVWRHCHEIRGQ
jgi:hypothetical protein